MKQEACGNSKRLIWIDLEMTGLVPDVDKILEIAILVTTSDLDIVAEFGPVAIKHDGLLLEDLNEWSQKVHSKSGLWQRVESSTIDTQTACKMAIDFLTPLVEHGVSPACGNTVFHDRRFLRKYMPELDDFFHYRCLDVSTLKELVRMWNPSILSIWKKPHPHMAMDDIKNSVEELRFYREHFCSVE